MPSLPLTSLTGHFDASDTDKLFTTYQSSGVHTGVPGDGGLVQIWDDEGDGIADVCFAWGATNTEPTFRSTTPLMLNSNLDWEGSVDVMQAYNQVVNTSKTLADFITNSAFTLLIAIYPESITLGNATVYTNHCVIGDEQQLWGIYLKDNGGTKEAHFYNFDSNEDVVVKTINTGAPYVLRFRHESGNIYGSVNGGAESSVASGNTHATGMSAVVRLGRSVGSTYYNGRIGEIAIYNAALTGTPLSDATTYFTDKWIGGGAPASRPNLLLMGVG